MNKTDEMIETIRAKVPREELLAQLAEEAGELAHAALKLRRTLITTNPTPVTPDEAMRALDEEIADVDLLERVLDIPRPNYTLAVIADMHKKLVRWVDRLRDRETTQEPTEAEAKAIDRMTPKKPEMRADGGLEPGVASHLCCPTCNSPVINYWKPGTKPKHCQFCGQALDWEEDLC